MSDLMPVPHVLGGETRALKVATTAGLTQIDRTHEGWYENPKDWYSISLPIMSVWAPAGTVFTKLGTGQNIYRSFQGGIFEEVQRPLIPGKSFWVAPAGSRGLYYVMEAWENDLLWEKP